MTLLPGSSMSKLCWNERERTLDYLVFAGTANHAWAVAFMDPVWYSRLFIIEMLDEWYQCFTGIGVWKGLIWWNPTYHCLILLGGHQINDGKWHSWYKCWKCKANDHGELLLSSVVQAKQIGGHFSGNCPWLLTKLKSVQLTFSEVCSPTASSICISGNGDNHRSSD